SAQPPRAQPERARLALDGDDLLVLADVQAEVARDGAVVREHLVPRRPRPGRDERHIAQLQSLRGAQQSPVGREAGDPARDALPVEEQALDARSAGRHADAQPTRARADDRDLVYVRQFESATAG